MKKSVISLVMALVLSLSLCAGAMASEAAFAFTAEEYMEGYTKFNADAMSKEITWGEATAIEGGLTGWLGTAEGMSDVCVYAMEGQETCYGIGSEINIGLSDADLTEKAQAFGMTVAAIPYATRYLELDYDIIALSEELSDIETACTTLVQNVFSSDAITTAVSDGSYSETIAVGGHNAQLTLKVDMDAMAMTVTFVYIP